MDPKSKYSGGFAAPPALPPPQVEREKEKRLKEQIQRQQAMRILKVKSILAPPSSSVQTSEFSLTSSGDTLHLSPSVPRPADIRRMVKEELGETLPPPPLLHFKSSGPKTASLSLTRPEGETRGLLGVPPSHARATSLDSSRQPPTLQSVLFPDATQSQLSVGSSFWDAEEAEDLGSHGRIGYLAEGVGWSLDSVGELRPRSVSASVVERRSVVNPRASVGREGMPSFPMSEKGEGGWSEEQMASLRKLFPEEIWGGVEGMEELYSNRTRSFSVVPPWFSFQNPSSPRKRSRSGSRQKREGSRGSRRRIGGGPGNEADGEMSDEDDEDARLGVSIDQKTTLESAEPFPPQVVFDINTDSTNSGKENSASSTAVTGSSGTLNDASLASRTVFDPPLEFESRFESGNLATATRVGKYHYELMVKKDSNTKGHTQWYYFRVKGLIPHVEYRFDVVNLMKTKSLYSQGLKPLMYSEAIAGEKGIGWHRVGFNINYMRNNLLSDPTDPAASKPLHTLTFTYSHHHPDDTLYFAHCYPYTYTDLHRDLLYLKSDPERSPYFRHTVIGKTVAGNQVDMVSITSLATRPEDLMGRKAIVVSARIHPGETNSSYMMRGLLLFLTSERKEAKELRDRFVIKAVPMLNPDGVIIGNYRCNVRGFDLNRHWRRDPEWSEQNTPEVKAIKSMMIRTGAAREIALYCDLHGHNRKHGIFIYGCHSNHNDEGKERPTSAKAKHGKAGKSPSRPGSRPISAAARGQNRSPWTSGTAKDDAALPKEISQYRERVFPFLLSRAAPSLFHFRRCQFKMQKSKEGTGRITVRKELNVLDSFTLEASFCGSDVGPPDEWFHYSIRDLEKMGEKIGLVLHSYLVEDEGKVADKAWKEILDGFSCGNKDLQPDLSDSSETTSDDEELRIKVKKKLTKKPTRPSVPQKVAFAASQTSVNDSPPSRRSSRPGSANGSRNTLTERQPQRLKNVTVGTKLKTDFKELDSARKRPSSAHPGQQSLYSNSKTEKSSVKDRSEGVYAFPVTHNSMTIKGGGLGASNRSKARVFSERPVSGQTQTYRHKRSESLAPRPLAPANVCLQALDSSTDGIGDRDKRLDESCYDNHSNEFDSNTFPSPSSFNTAAALAGIASDPSYELDNILQQREMRKRALPQPIKKVLIRRKGAEQSQHQDGLSVQHLEYNPDTLVHMLFSKPRKKAFEARKVATDLRALKRPWDTNRVLELQD
ncbi:Cytosolic carboxypeptidase 2 [Phlyctochytrium bullatum]|nr:Cytosolic carboxypeptidase 2 [Phlyctochytrium bullatum]